MDSIKLGSGDNNSTVRISPRIVEEELLVDDDILLNGVTEMDNHSNKLEKISERDEITPQMINDNEIKLKERIAQCRNIIESLKFELSEEKTKLEKESKSSQYPSQIPETVLNYASGYNDFSTSDSMLMADVSYTSVYSACVDSKLNCDDNNLMEYEKQLQKYQNTLNMAQIEKKNAIRKQMLAKAFKLKLLEVENQCNIELLRVKQCLQCMEPLKMIASKWKTNSDDAMYDFSNFELMPRYPELNANSGSDVNSFYKEEVDNNIPADKPESIENINDSASSDC